MFLVYLNGLPSSLVYLNVPNQDSLFLSFSAIIELSKILNVSRSWSAIKQTHQHERNSLKPGCPGKHTASEERLRNKMNTTSLKANGKWTTLTLSEKNEQYSPFYFSRKMNNTVFVFFKENKHSSFCISQGKYRILFLYFSRKMNNTVFVFFKENEHSSFCISQGKWRILFLYFSGKMDNAVFVFFKEYGQYCSCIFQGK